MSKSRLPVATSHSDDLQESAVEKERKKVKKTEQKQEPRYRLLFAYPSKDEQRSLVSAAALRVPWRRNVEGLLVKKLQPNQALRLRTNSTRN
jgi:hypothetical protein